MITKNLAENKTIFVNPPNYSIEMFGEIMIDELAQSNPTTKEFFEMFGRDTLIRSSAVYQLLMASRNWNKLGVDK